jgi:hypothetical protein
MNTRSCKKVKSYSECNYYEKKQFPVLDQLKQEFVKLGFMYEDHLEHTQRDFPREFYYSTNFSLYYDEIKDKSINNIVRRIISHEKVAPHRHFKALNVSTKFSNRIWVHILF